MDIIAENSPAKVRKTIYLIRHGETEYNKQNIIQGSGVDSSLNDLGREQARRFYNHYKTVSFDKIYTSKLKRTIESVSHFIDAGIPYESLEALNEINWGIMEGRQSTPEAHAEFMDVVTAWREGDLERRVEGGETPLTLYSRQETGLDYILSHNNENTIMIAMHGRAMRSFLCLMLQHPLHLMDDFAHSNLCLYVLEWDGEKIRMVTENNTEHLIDL